MENNDESGSGNESKNDENDDVYYENDSTNMNETESENESNSTEEDDVVDYEHSSSSYFSSEHNYN